MVLDIEMSEFVSNEVAIVHEQSSQDVRGANVEWRVTR
ncbi:hypothetical protein PC113_g2667 [Phytophthora cactorum]|uniref:Uncharacterized protein n=1 Tax=Phytophthora cactorum TaxID=29920 RepID=A0A8T0ZWB6_9STRA|nr:hypothetical protein PC113_g2667 [Phytophthora cactorum]